MANNEPNKPEDVKIMPGQEAPADEKAAPATPLETGGDTPAPEIAAEEVAALEHGGKSAQPNMGDDGLKPPPPFDIPAPGDVVVSFDKINEIVSGKQAAAKEAEQSAAKKEEAEKSGPAEEKAGQKKLGPDKGKPPIEKAAANKPKADRGKPAKESGKNLASSAKQEKAVKPTKSDKSPEQPKQETPPPAPIEPPEPKEAPRPGEQRRLPWLYHSGYGKL